MNEIIGDIAEWLLEIKQNELTEETFIDVDNEFGDNLKKTPERIIKDFKIENKIESEYISNQDKLKLVKLLNKKYGISKVEISKMLGISRSQIYRLQNRHSRDVR